LVQRRGCVGEITEPLDVDEAMRPCLLDLCARHESTHRKVRVQTVPGLVPLAGPKVWEGSPADAQAETPEEAANVAAEA
jgi:hypothetical protein